jgi:phosphoglycolate phosphatase
MGAVIERLASAHPVVIITSSRTSVVEGILAEHRVRGVAAVIGGDQEASKTRKIREVRRRFGEQLPAWYVCDTVGDVVEAREAGAHTVGVAWGWHGEERLLHAAPDLIAQTPGDLLGLF